MFTHHFTGSIHDCGELEIRPLDLTFKFVANTSNRQDLDRAIDLGKKFSAMCYFHFTPKISGLLTDSEDSEDSDSDDENEVCSNPRSLEHWHGYNIRYSFENEITLDKMRIIFNELKNTHGIQLFLTDSCLKEITQAIEVFFAQKLKKEEKEIDPPTSQIKFSR